MKSIRSNRFHPIEGGQPLRVEKADDGEIRLKRSTTISQSWPPSPPNDSDEEEQLERELREAHARPRSKFDGSGARLMPDYLLDCNHLSAALRKVSRVRDRMRRA